MSVTTVVLAAKPQRNCITCAFHDPKAVSIDDAPTQCWACSSLAVAALHGPLPNWMPKAVIPIVPAKGPNPAVPTLEEMRRFTPGAPPMKTQVGGSHYTSMAIQPLEYARVNNLDYFQKDIMKYTQRIKGDKAKRLEDLRKAQHYLALYIDGIESGAWPALGLVPAV